MGGDTKVGKTWLITTFITGENPSDQIPTIFDSFSNELEIRKQQVELSLWDTAGDLKYDRIRQLSYPNTDIFFICYAINSIRSFENVRNWYNEIREISQMHNIPIILVATKDDIKEDNSVTDIVTLEMAHSMKQELNLTDFVETSALERKKSICIVRKGR